MTSPLIVALCLLGQSEPLPSVELQEIRRLLREEAAPPKDLSLIFTSEFRYVGPTEELKFPAERFNMDSQGIFLTRADGAGYLEHIEKLADPKALVVRQATCVLGEDREMARGLLDEVQWIDRDRNMYKSRGSLVTFAGFGMPFRLLISLFLRTADHLDGRDYVHEGWEEIDGRRCLKFRVRATRDSPPENVYRYWLDLERGVNVLKFETRDRDRLISRTDGIELAGFKTSHGRTYWLPIRGKHELFVWRERFFEQPVVRETFLVDQATVRLDLGLPETLFSLRESAENPPPSSLRPLFRAYSAMPLAQMFVKQKAPEEAP
ncbi:MAG: hypothetical protein AB7I30_12955 [Isosphaeraceae bacterium]